jgi:phage gpG-like protein
MTTFTIDVKDQGVQSALQALAARVSNMDPVLQTLGERIVERTKRRFETSTGPDGVKWEGNKPSTMAMFAGRLSGHKGKVKKDGSLNASGLRAYLNKKPLIGESQELRKQFTISASNGVLTVGSTMKYAAIQQFGGITGAKSWIPGKNIPARPFLPVRSDGSLYPQEQSEILEAINAYLAEGL